MDRTVVCTPDTCGGSPRIDGTRLTCANVVESLRPASLSVYAFLSYYPYLSRDDVRSCLEYCASRRCLQDRPAKYCQGCSLDQSPPIDEDDAAQGKEDLWRLAGEILAKEFQTPPS